MSEKVLITSDSTTDLSPEQLECHHIPLMRLVVSVNDVNHVDGIDITPDEIYRNYEQNKSLPKTAAPSLADCTEFFRKYVDQGYHIVHFTISSEMSCTYQNSVIAAEEFENIHVVDTRNLSTGGGLLVLKAVELAEKGMSAAMIAEECRRLTPYVDASFVIDSLTFLHKGGRCSALAMLGANLMNLKPCIVVKDGKMSVGAKYRGKFDAVLQKYIADRIGDGEGIDRSHIFITHGGCDDEILEACVAKLRSLGDFPNIHVTRAGCTISSHCGRNTLGVLFLRDHPI
ncbi:MAG: DegV family protein [Oscillospiraceae bacterium]|nr:DegV family protein [Oscillospiraceae bacterium]